MNTPESLLERLQVYAKCSPTSMTIEKQIGFGQDGAVWKSSRGTAVKSFERPRNYQNERDAYLKFKNEQLNRIGPFDVPTLIAIDDDLMIIEMGIVSPPYLLDFGKAYVDRVSPYTNEQIAQSMEESRLLFGAEDWPVIEDAILELKLMGIVYLDIKPANIRVR